MRLKRCILPIAGTIFLSVTAVGYSQVGPAARSTNLPLAVGAGFSNYNADWDNARVSGGTVWINYYPGIISRHLPGLGLDLEARDLSYLKTTIGLQGWKQDTAAGGAIYSWHHFQNIRPYAKGLYGYGSFDFNLGRCCVNYKHDTRSVEAMGAGMDVHVFRHFWARGDYEYQIWQPLFGKTTNATPNGFTFGGIFDFRSPSLR